VEGSPLGLQRPGLAKFFATSQQPGSGLCTSTKRGIDQDEGLEITAFSVNHIVPCAGFVVRQNSASFLYSGDTYQTEKIWEAAAKDAHLKAAMIETTFPNALEDLAVKSKHLTPRLLLTEFTKIGKPSLPLYIYHVKPRYLDVVSRELDALQIENMTVLEDGAILDIR
jgi:ribonuclease BN (tRNA processing enzyme)